MKHFLKDIRKLEKMKSMQIIYLKSQRCFLYCQTCKVVAIYSKMFDEENFSECTYMAKDVDEKLFPERIIEKLKIGR